MHPETLRNAIDSVVDKNILFISLDIVDSTSLKEHKSDWGDILQKTLKQMSFYMVFEHKFNFWKAIGDEYVYTAIVTSDEDILKRLKQVQDTITSLCSSEENKQDTAVKGGAWIVSLAKNENEADLREAKKIVEDGKKYPEFYDLSTYVNKIQDSKISHIALTMPHYQHKLDGQFNDVGENSGTNLAKARVIRYLDFIGSPMDHGFRVSAQAKTGTLFISSTLFAVIERFHKDVHKVLGVYRFVELKGVWKGSAYPPVFFNLNEKEITAVHNELNYDAEDEVGIKLSLDLALHYNYKYNSEYTNHVITNLEKVRPVKSEIENNLLDTLFSVESEIDPLNFLDSLT
jgi:hypothetical protein